MRLLALEAIGLFKIDANSDWLADNQSFIAELPMNGWIAHRPGARLARRSTYKRTPSRRRARLHDDSRQLSSAVVFRVNRFIEIGHLLGQCRSAGPCWHTGFPTEPASSATLVGRANRTHPTRNAVAAAATLPSRPTKK